MDYMKKKTNETYVFVLFIFSGSSIISNISDFKDFNVNQIDINKTDPWQNNWLII